MKLNNEVSTLKSLPIIRGNVLNLRPMRDTDAARILEIYGDPLVMKYTDEKPFADLTTVSTMLRSVRTLFHEGQSLEWAIELNGADLIIGTCGLHTFDKPSATAEVGCLLHREAWGNGHMTHALNLLAKFAAEKVQIRRLLADVAPENQRALRLFNRLGYRRICRGILVKDLS
ncbi:MAG: GNAT family N-acetyltransferase [Burkholderiaceae bacterium]|nr:GNAT family N-acetyltransferase [Burkholderiaceae bacterium]